MTFLPCYNYRLLQLWWHLFRFKGGYKYDAVWLDNKHLYILSHITPKRVSLSHAHFLLSPELAALVILRIRTSSSSRVRVLNNRSPPITKQWRWLLWDEKGGVSPLWSPPVQSPPSDPLSCRLSMFSIRIRIFFIHLVAFFRLMPSV